LRAFEKYAVRAGGGVNHRFGLYDAILVKDNHIAAAGGLADALQRVRARAGLWSVFVTGGVVFGISWFGSPPVQSIFALLLTAFLLLGAVRTVVELHGSRSRRGAMASDADQLARLTHVPGIVWVAVFLSVAIASAWLAARFLGLL